ncbi:6621_t:CDS:2 [Acaulospora morrowiae]|uniref:6621_t:CDS:1 n=1 Tax=Acaulospora morrowiae TaxID=94023 RepID=A0A9N9C9K0_9GLOM|nr:6621_t:CDS:2 [Acaulospora morrowiae]
MSSDLEQKKELFPLVEGSEWQLNWEAKRNKIIRPLVSECVATFLYCFFGDGATLFVGMSSLSQQQNPISGRLNVSLSIAVGIMLAIYFGIPFSGGHATPNLTLVFTVFRKFPWKLAPLYVLAQTVGGFIGTGMAYLCFYSTVHNVTSSISPFNGTSLANTDGPFEFASLYVATPNNYVSTGYIIWVEFISNAILILLVFGLSDPKKMVASTPVLVPLLVGLVAFLLGIGVGYEGIAVSSARDIGARLFLWIIYGSEIWRSNNYYFWVVLVVPLIGSLAGGAFYDFFFYDHEKPKEQLPC